MLIPRRPHEPLPYTGPSLFADDLETDLFLLTNLVTNFSHEQPFNFNVNDFRRAVDWARRERRGACQE